MSGVDVRLRPGDLNEITLEVRESWGLDARDGCWHVAAYSVNEEGVRSEVVTLSDTPGCVPVPEPSVTTALAAGAVWLGAATVLGPVIGRWLRWARAEDDRAALRRRVAGSSVEALARAWDREDPDDV